MMAWMVIRIADDGRGWMDGDVGARDLGKVGAKRGALLGPNFRPSSNRPLPALFSLYSWPRTLSPEYLNFIINS